MEGKFQGLRRHKGNQTMRYGQSIEYNMRINFLEKSSTKCGRETSSILFKKNSKLRTSLEQQSEVSYSLLLSYVLVEDYRNI